MAQVLTKELPDPVMYRPSQEELKEINAQLLEYAKNFDHSGMASMASKYPCSAESLDGLKDTVGIEFILMNKINIINAVEKYGMEWIK